MTDALMSPSFVVSTPTSDAASFANFLNFYFFPIPQMIGTTFNACDNITGRLFAAETAAQRSARWCEHTAGWNYVDGASWWKAGTNPLNRAGQS